MLSLGQLAGFTSRRRRTVSWFVAAVLTLAAQVALSGPAESARRAKKGRQAAPEPASASAEPGQNNLAGAINQAVAQFQIWTDRPAPRDVMREVVVRHLTRGR